jgi:Flp pilus assembly protein TadG
MKLRRWGAKMGREGSAAIEFAVFIPTFAIFVTGVIELGFGIYQAVRVSNAAEAGMLYASKNGFNATGISSAVANATGIPGISASPAPTQFCGCPSSTGITTISCSSTCANGNAPGQYIQVNAQIARVSLVSFPGLGLPSTLSATAILRTN